MSKPFGDLPEGASGTFNPFTVAIEEQQFADFETLLRLSKVAGPTYESLDEGRKYGVSAKWLADAKEYWLSKFHWRESEKRINVFPNFTTTIEDGGDDFTVHFAALFSKKPGAVPIINVHGWPGSFLEFLPMMSLYAQQYTPETLPFHIIVPSLAGYTFSSGAPLHRDFGVSDATRILDKLMHRLGFGAGYIATGGDIGSGVARLLAHKYDACKAVHLNFCNIRKPDSVADADLDDDDRAAVARGAEFMTTGHGYAIMHGTRPSTTGLVLASNPLALLAWVGEKFLTWTDEDPSLDTILEAVSLWWFTDTMPRSMYPYRHSFEGKAKGASHADMYITKPFGYSLFPKEVIPIPRLWAATTGDLRFFRKHESGGHFAALEKPELLKKDIEDFVEHVKERGVVFE